jgi:predicted deacylase
MAGNHGDEYEGQVGLGKLIRALEPSPAAFAPPWVREGMTFVQPFGSGSVEP